MKLIPIGSIIGNEPPYNRFAVPEGAKHILINPPSGEILFEVENVKEFLLDDKDYQFLNEKTGLYIKVSFKKSGGKFKGVPVK